LILYESEYSKEFEQAISHFDGIPALFHSYGVACLEKPSTPKSGKSLLNQNNIPFPINKKENKD